MSRPSTRPATVARSAARTSVRLALRVTAPAATLKSSAAVTKRSATSIVSAPGAGPAWVTVTSPPALRIERRRPGNGRRRRRSPNLAGRDQGRGLADVDRSRRAARGSRRAAVAGGPLTAAVRVRLARLIVLPPVAMTCQAPGLLPLAAAPVAVAVPVTLPAVERCWHRPAGHRRRREVDRSAERDAAIGPGPARCRWRSGSGCRRR